MSSDGEQKKPLDVNAIIEAKRQRMGKGSSATEEAKAKANQAGESARQAAAERAPQGQPQTRAEEPHERLARLGEARKQQARLLSDIHLVPVDDAEKDKVLGPSGSGKRQVSRRRRRSKRMSARAGRSSGSHPGSSGAGLILGIGAAVVVGIVLVLLLFRG